MKRRMRRLARKEVVLYDPTSMSFFRLGCVRRYLGLQVSIDRGDQRRNAVNLVAAW